MAATARLVHLPEVGIRGNTHFLMSDLNNVQIADQVSQFLAGKEGVMSDTLSTRAGASSSEPPRCCSQVQF
jgi:hypothetical protein